MRQRVIGNATIRRAGLVLGVGLAICLGEHAARPQDAPTSVTIDVGDCVGLKSPDERLACFDRRVEAAKAKRDASPAPPTSAAAASAAEPRAEVTARAAAAATPAAAVPGSSAPPAALPSTGTQGASAASAGHGDRAQRDAQSTPPEIVATVTELHETVPNAWLITLDNGQVWRQNVPQRFALKPGARVTLRGTKWGAAYRLSAATLNGFIQVERVR